VHKYKDDDRLQSTFEPCMTKLTTLQHEESTELVENMYQLSSLQTAPPPVATTKDFSSDSACNALVWDRNTATHLLVNTFKPSLTGNGSRTAEAYTRGKHKVRKCNQLTYKGRDKVYLKLSEFSLTQKNENFFTWLPTYIRLYDIITASYRPDPTGKNQHNL
jgi:hypothetical protein